MAAVNTCFIGVGCNRTPSATCWGNNGLIAYGACRGIAIYSPMVGSSCGGHVDSIWVSHTDRVNSVQWIPCDDKETEAVSASADSTAVVWRLRDNEMKPIATLSGHTASVTKAVGMYVRATDKEEPATLVATTSADSTVKLWRRESNEDYFTCVQTISVGSGFALDIAWAKLPSSGIPLLACGCDDQKIHLYAEQESQFVKVQTLIGHEDWLRGLEFTEDDNGDLLLASCGQDCFIRLWRIRVGSEQQSTLVDENTTTSGQQPHLVDDIKVKEISFSVGIEGGSKMYDVLLESILMAHDNWIYGVHWQPAVYTDEGKRHQPMCLLSASMDKTMIIWRPDPATGVWIDQVRVGEVGGNTLGLYGSQFSPDGKSILAHGYQGAFHLWHFEQETNNWSPEVTVSGHFNAVQDIAWDPNGEFLLSASTDQTMRLYAPWRRDNQKIGTSSPPRPKRQYFPQSDKFYCPLLV